MNGYAGTLHELTQHYDGISVTATPPARADQLHAFLAHRIHVVQRALPEDPLQKDQEVRCAIVIGLLCQDCGLTDYPDVHAARAMERLVGMLEYERNCSVGENAMRGVVSTDRRCHDVVTPTELAAPLCVLLDETIHAEGAHLPHLLHHVGHCPSFRPQIDAVRLLGDALPAALHALVGDPTHAAYWILTGEPSARKTTLG